jgi:hypothetical protein
MFPAMDRSRMTTSGRARAAIGLGLVALGVAFPGCARLRSERTAHAPATLGSERVGDGYSSFHAARATSATATADPAPAEVAQADPPAPGGMVTEALPPIELQTPVSPAATSRLASATQGVPNASRLLASTERDPAPAPEPAPAQAADVGQMVAEARSRLDRATTYQAAMHRQERVGTTLLPAEDLIVSIRREPKAVRLSWPEGPNKGREAIYRADSGDGKMHVNMPNSGLPVTRLAFAPDSPMVMRNSRHPITEAGFDSIIRDLEQALQSPGTATVTYAGMETPAPLDRPHPCIVRTNAAGEVARVYLDPESRFPAFVEVKTATGDLLEHYVFRDIRVDLPELADAGAFDQEARWGPARGLFGRVARGTEEKTPR